jgi:hypothetical protein
VKIGIALRELHRSENELAQRLHHVAERHPADTDISLLVQDLARWSEEHVRSLAAVAPRYEVKLSDRPRQEHRWAVDLRRGVGAMLAGRSDAGLLLLADLREIYLAASGVSVDWELVAQAAQGARDVELIDLAQRCHSDNLRQMRWANAMLKNCATQVLVS